MVSKLSILLGVSFLVMGSVLLSAQQDQPLIYLEDKTVASGEQVTLEVFVLNYDSILGTTFSLLWDTTKLEFVAVSDIFPGMGSLDDNFNTSLPGELRYLFVTNNVENGGVSITDGTSLFSITMNVIAAPTEENMATDLTFGGTLEVIDVQENAYSNFIGATVTIRGLVDTETPDDFVSLSAVVTPNPFSEAAQISIGLAQQEEIHWQLSDVSGRLITQGKNTFRPGQHRLTIPKRHFKRTGTYLLSLQAGEKRLTRQLYFIENR